MSDRGLDLTIPLMDGDTAILRVPRPLSEENYDYLMDQIKMFKRGLVAKPPVAPQGKQEAAEDQS